MAGILLFGAGKSATSLIRYLIAAAGPRGWQLTVADSNLSLVQSKIGGAANARAASLSVEEESERDRLVGTADVVISLLPPSLHHLVARSCLRAGKHLLTASYTDDSIRAMKPDIDRSGKLFLCEMGLDPGIDHMSALHFIDKVRRLGEAIVSFHSHTGGLIAPESDDNPWHYKISWNPRNVVRAGASGARFRADGRVVERSYAELFEQTGRINLKETGPLAWYPNRDSLPYMALYSLEGVETFIRTTLRYPVFCKGWAPIVRAGLTDDVQPLKDAGGSVFAPRALTIAHWSAPLLPYVDEHNRKLYEYLGLFSPAPVPANARTSADVLQFLLETRLKMRPRDRDMIVMQHEIGCSSGASYKSTLVVKGEDSLDTAMARTVGLPLGIAAKLLLDGKLSLTGLQIPVSPELYVPVLKELELQGIGFEEEGPVG
ncbi:MAG TPA: saccharopine dehydrogenase C-terminal domain-containing protein [Puia sp.]|nr:saccharopine dehydrogenase C-terminal domain-containing protein [Puia sp.]